MKFKIFFFDSINKFKIKKKNSYISLKNSSSKIFRSLEFIKDSKISIIYLSGVFFYLLSLWHIDALDMKCFFIKEGVECYYTLAKFIFISSFLNCISIYLIIIKKYNKKHLNIIFFIYLFLFYIDHNDGIIKHGFYNIIGFITINIFILYIFSFIHFFYFLFLKKKYFFTIILISILFLLYNSFKLYKLNHFSCDNWSKGLNGSTIDNLSKDYPCRIKIPKSHSCYMPEIGPYFDLTTKYRPTCLDPKILKNEKKNFIKDMLDVKYFKLSNKSHFGFPLTNTDNINPYEYGNICYFVNKSFVEYIYNNIILMDLYYKDKDKYYPNVSKPEVEVFFEGKKGKFLINVQRNETLIKERNNILKNNKKSLYQNVLVFFFDTLSRAHFFRKFPKTINFFNQLVKYETNYEKKNMTIFQYFKYHSLNTYTDPNLIAAYYGAKLKGNGIHFGRYFKENGFIIGRVHGYCEKESCVNLKNLSALTHTRFDHEGVNIGCIKAFFKGMLVSGGSSVVKRCLFGKEIYEYALNYLESFWVNYLDQKKMFLMNIDEGHEPTGELIGHFDIIFYNFLNKFYSNGYFKNTSIIIFSDHGMHINGPLYLFDSQDFFFERTLATLFLIIPNDEILYKDNLYEKMKSNQQTFVTPFDIYNTLIYLAVGEMNEYYFNYSIPFGDSLFNKLNYKNRFCQSPIYDSQINIKYCSCEIVKN